MSRRRARIQATRRRAQSARRSRDHGFTLVEMMVSITLVVLIMLMFTEIFQVFTATMGKQKGIGSNDQRSRTLTTVIRGDLDKRTFRVLIPFGGHENPFRLGPAPRLALGDLDNRQGYFHVCENDPNIDSDDVLQFTMRATILLKNQDESPFYGRAVLLYPVTEQNQPIWDDGDVRTEDRNGNGVLDAGEDVNSNGRLDSNNSSASTEAEVVYFLRAGNLYRRTMLIRKPLAGINGQPRNSNGYEFFDPNNNGMGGRPPLFSGEFYRDFDFSAFYSPIAGLRFHSTNSLNNHYREPGITSTPLAVPSYRFGFAHFVSGDNDYAGQPRDYIGTGAARRFMGRFTHEETSHRDFNYPFDNTNEPMNRNAATTLTMNSQGAVSQFYGDPNSRRAEDILMTNVHSFDVKVWDELLQRFVDIGHNLRESDFDGNPAFNAATEDLNRNGINDIGYFHRANNSNPGFGPNLPADGLNNVFDTWHPQVDLVTSEDTNSNGILDIDEDANGNGVLDPGEDLNGNGVLDVAEDQNGNGRIDSVRGNDGIVDAPPYRPFNTTGVVPIKSVRITIRFKDTKSDQMRQLTIVHSMLD